MTAPAGIDMGLNQTCLRSACAQREPHKAGRHLDQRDKLYDGPHCTLQVLPLAVRESAQRLVREAPALMPEVMDLAEHVEFLRRQVAVVQVDGHRREREAMARSADCAHHGSEIEELGQQLYRAGQAHQATEAGRVALLGFLHVVEDFVRTYPAGGSLTVKSLVDELDKATRKASAAHMRAWKR